MGWVSIPLALIVLAVIGVAVVKRGLPPKNEIVAILSSASAPRKQKHTRSNKFCQI